MTRRIAATLLAASLVLPGFALAQRPISPLKVGEDEVRLPLKDDLYVAGGNPRIDEELLGDLTIIGGNVTVSGNVGDDVQAAGGTVFIRGDVGGNVRVAGGNVTVEGRVEGNVVVLGGQLTIARGASVGGDVLAAGGQVVMDGDVRGAFKGDGGTVRVGGVVSGITDIRAEAVDLSGRMVGGAVISAKEWRTTGTAAVRGGLRYWRPDGKTVELAVEGENRHDESLKWDDRPGKAEAVGMAAALIGVFSVLSLLFAALTIGLLMLLTRTYFKDAAARLDKSPWPSLLTGFLYFVATPVLALIFMITIIGLPIGLFLLMAYVFSFVFAFAYTALTVAWWIDRRWNRRWKPWAVFLVALLVYVAMKVVLLVPFLGWIAVDVVVCMAFGALLHVKYEKYLAIR
jgi:cytoskeletal protein CcmA (bactofilin family)